MKVAVYAIAKDERRQVERFMASVAEADVVVVLDTGSSDGTPERLAELGAQVGSQRVSPWRFDDARNAALALVPEDVDVCVALDLDEALEPGWRAALDAAWQPGVTRVRYWYEWSHHPDGSPDLSFLADKIHARHGYRWRYPVHEELEPLAAEQWATAELRVVHRPAEHAHRGRYLELIEQGVAERPDNHRFAYYLTREYTFHRRWEDVLRAGERYLALPGRPWHVEQAATVLLLAQAARGLGDDGMRLHWLDVACGSAPGEREPWVALAEACHERGNWRAGLDAAQRALAIPTRPSHFLTDSRAWGGLPHDLASICAWQLNERGFARRQLRAALAHDPHSERLRANAQAMGIDPDSRAYAPSRADIALVGAVVVARDTNAAIEPTLSSLGGWCSQVVVVAPPGAACADDVVVERITADASLAEINLAVRRAADGLVCEWLVVALAGDIFALADDALDELAYASAGALAVVDAGATQFSTRIVRSERVVEVELAAGDLLTGAALPIEPLARVTLTAGAIRAVPRDLDDLRARVRRQPGDILCWRALALVAESLGERQLAIDAWLRLLDGGEDAWAGWAAWRAAVLLNASNDDATAWAVIARGLTRSPALAELPWLAGWIAWQRGEPEHAAAWARMAAANGWRAGEDHLNLSPDRYLPGCFEGPHDVLRYALRALGDDAGAAEAERRWRMARETRLRIVGG